MTGAKSCDKILISGLGIDSQLLTLRTKYNPLNPLNPLYPLHITQHFLSTKLKSRGSFNPIISNGHETITN